MPTIAAGKRDDERYRAFVAHSVDGIWCLEFERPIPVSLAAHDQAVLLESIGYVSEANDALARGLGLSRGAQLLGLGLGEIVPGEPAARLRLLMDFVRAGYRTTDSELQFDRQGTTRFSRHTLIGIVQGRKLVRVWGVQRDCTDRRRLEDQLRQAQKMEAIGQLAGGVAHDFNNLLTAIIGFGEIVRSELGEGHRLQPDMEQVLAAARRAEALTRQLLAFSRKQVLRPEPLNLSEIVSSFEPMLARLIGEDVQVNLRLDSSVPAIHADRGQIEQLIMNLVVNARDAMPDGGTIVIETSTVNLTGPASSIRASAHPRRDVCLAISDSGCGMTPEVQARIFEPFFTTKGSKGTGLGLSTAYGIVQQSGGEITVSSEPGAGTTFRIYLPAAGDTRAPLVSLAGGSSVVGGFETILLVEDDEGVRDITAQALARLGYQLMVAASAEEALAMAAQFDGTIDVLLTDLVMPGLNGRMLAEMLHATRGPLRVLLTSGYAEAAAAVDDTSSGITPAFLQKPYSLASLAGAVRRLLDGGDTPQTLH